MNTESEEKRSVHRKTLKLLSLQQLSAVVFTHSSAVFLVKFAVNSLRVFHQWNKSEFIIRIRSLQKCKAALLESVPALLADFVTLWQAVLSRLAVVCAVRLCFSLPTT